MGEADNDVRRRGVQTKYNLQIIFVDHIVQNDATHDCVETDILFEELLNRIREELPLCKNIWVVSDNAIFYKNDLFWPIFLRISGLQVLDLKGVIHPAAQDGKKMVDGQFSIAKMHTMCFVNER